MKSNLHNTFILLTIVLVTDSAFAQDSYVVNAPSLNVRTESNTKSLIIGKLSSGDVVSIINSDNPEWWQISFYGTEGYVSSKFLISLDESEQFKDWKKEEASTGDNPECENITPEYDRELDNELLIHVGNNTDAIVKLMNYSETCIRIAYIKAGDNYSLKNIPEGIYYLKIAYGKEFRKYTENGQCIVRFLRDATYKKSTKQLNYFRVKKPDTIEGDFRVEHWSLPSFELSLSIEYTQKSFRSFHSDKISVEEFNR